MSYQTHKSLWVASIVILLITFLTAIVSKAAPELKPIEQPSFQFVLLKEYVDWCKTTEPGYIHDLRFSLASNQQTGLVSYAEGMLNFKPTTNTFEGTGTQFFNDRRYNSPQSYPFNSKQTDQIGLIIEAANGKFNLTLNSWGGGKLYINSPQYTNGVLYGFSTPGTPTLYTISLKKNKSAIIK